MYGLMGGFFLAWSIGANDAANCFGTAVSSNMVRYRTAVILTAIFVILGSVLGGERGIKTVGSVTHQDILSSSLGALAAAITVTAMTLMRLPVSASQATIGSLLGIAMAMDLKLYFGPLKKVIICWLGTPIGAAIISMGLYWMGGAILDMFRINIVFRGILIKAGLIFAGTYGAYALGANNVGNVAGIYYQTNILPPSTFILGSEVLTLALFGGIGIAIGALTFSRNVMVTVGTRLVDLDAFSALVAVLAGAIIVHLYALVGAPVSTSQAIVGGVFGIGLAKGMKTINYKTVIGVIFGWIGTPLIAMVLAFFLSRLFLTS